MTDRQAFHPEVMDFPDDEKRREIVNVFGKTGTGKTTFMRELILFTPRVIVIDPIGEYGGPVFDEPEDMLNYAIDHENFLVRSRSHLDLPLLCDVAAAVKNCSLVIEEAQNALPPSRQDLPVELEDMIFRGRHRSVSLVFSAQRPMTLHINARSQWSRIIAFHESEPGDVDWLERTSGQCLTKPGMDIRHLQIPGEYLDIRPGSITKERTKIIPLSFTRRRKEEETTFLSRLQFATSGLFGSQPSDMEESES